MNRISPVPKATRIRDDAYKAHIRSLPCLLGDRTPCECGGYLDVASKRHPIEAAHVRSRGAGGGDEQLVPLCSKHHREAHRIGHKSFEKRHRLDLATIAKRLRAGYLHSTSWEERQ